MLTRLIVGMAVLAMLAANGAVPADDIDGAVSIIDGDTLEIRGERIRLYGVDTPEAAQTCLDATGREWRCGQRAALALADRTA